jgi:DNA-binding GntR family transcriptional regulator
MLPLSLPRLTSEDFAYLRVLARKLDFEEVTLEEALAFYMILIRPADMPVLMEMTRNLIQRATRLFSIVHANRLALQNVSPTRLEMVEAMASGDLQAGLDAFRAYHLIRQEGLLKAMAEQG